MKRPHRAELSTYGDADDRFEGEYPAEEWHRGRDAEASITCYAPSKYPTKPWPTEAQLESWCSLPREACKCFVLAAEMPGGDELLAMNSSTSQPRVAGSKSTAALNTNQPPGANGNAVRDRVESALDTAFSGISGVHEFEAGSSVPMNRSPPLSATDSGPSA